jgi:hypothetical protein
MLGLLTRLPLSDAVSHHARALSRLISTTDRTAQDFTRIQSAFVEVVGTRPAHGDIELASRRLVACLIHLANRAEIGTQAGKEALAAAVTRIAAAELAALWMPRTTRHPLASLTNAA